MLSFGRSTQVRRVTLARAVGSSLIMALAVATGIDLKPPDPNKLSAEQRERASELFQALKEHQDDHAKRTEIIKEMCAVGRGVAQKMFDILDRQWEPKWVAYRRAFGVAAKKAARAKNTGAVKQEIARLEEQVQSLRNKGNLSKEDVNKLGDPALKRLKELKILTIAEILAADPALAPTREEILAIAEQRSYCIDQLILLEDEAQPFGVEDVSVYETQAAAAALGPPAEYLSILTANEKLQGKVPDAELEAVRDMNRYRTLIGLRPCALDPKLCDASRGHSKDMAERNFFAHESPVAGKETPWKRAVLAGTTASSENIYGGGDGLAATRAWWYSPGLHKNMLNAGARWVGMGALGGKWTHMFGR